jgi:FMN-dependent oxidoreductase (nitrilotriacetate monooxygenase family)
MASVTKNLSFAITTSTSYEAPYTVAKRFSTLDHLTRGRFGWNIVTSFKASGSKALGQTPVPHDKRYERADEYLEVLYKLWESSWADDALVEDRANELYADYSKIKWVHHHGPNYTVDAPHILDPSPQRTPFLFQAGTSAAGMAFGGKHAEGIFMSALSPHILAPRVKKVRAAAAAAGRDPQSVKVFAIVTPIIGRTEEEAQEKYQEALKYASFEGGLAFYAGNTGLNFNALDLDKVIRPDDQSVDVGIHSMVDALNYHGNDLPPWTPRNIGKIISIGGNGPVPVGTAAHVADVLEEWMEIADLDGFNIGYVLTPGTFEDVVELLVPELRRRGRYAPKGESGTMRERIYGKGQSRLRDDHPGSRFKYGVYEGKDVGGEFDDENGNRVKP